MGCCQAPRTSDIQVKLLSESEHSFEDIRPTQDNHPPVKESSQQTHSGAITFKQRERKDSYPQPPLGIEASNHAKIQGWTWSESYKIYEEYMLKISVDRRLKMDDVRDGRLRLLMILMKEFGYTEQVDAIVNKIHTCIHERLMLDDITPTDIYNVGILCESIACNQITLLEPEIPQILAKDIDLLKIWETKGVGLRAHGTSYLMCYLQRNEKNRFTPMMHKGMDTLQSIMKPQMDKDLWKQCASIVVGLAKVMTQKQYDVLTMISANIMNQIAKDTIAAYKQISQYEYNEEMKSFTAITRQDHEDALAFPQIMYNRATFIGEDWMQDIICCDGNPIVDLKEWKAFIEHNDIDKKEWGFGHESLGAQLTDVWSITEGDDQKELEEKLKNGELIIGQDVNNNYLSFLLSLSEKISEIFQGKIHDLYSNYHKAGSVKKMNQCLNELRGKYANCAVPKSAELTDTIRCEVVFADFSELVEGYKTLKENFTVCSLQNGFDLEEKDVSFGYRNVLINVIFDAGFCNIVCELEFTLDLFYKLKNQLKEYYAFHECGDSMEMIVPCNQYIDRLVTTIEQQKSTK